MIKVLSGETDTENIEAWMKEQGIREEDEVTVCELFDQYVRQGRTEGRAEGRSEERIFIIHQLQKEGVDEAFISRITNCTKEELAIAAGR